MMKQTLEALQADEKKKKRNKIISAFLIGFLIGVMIYGIAKSSDGILHILIPVMLIIGIAKNAQKEEAQLKEIQAAINAKKQKS